jgi:hypothetical protein
LPVVVAFVTRKDGNDMRMKKDLLKLNLSEIYPKR